MLKRVGDMVDEGSNLLEARVQVLLQRLARTGVLAAGYVGAVLIACGGFLTLVAALTVWMAQHLGVAAALAISGALLGVLALATVLALRAWWARPDERQQALEREVQAARQAFRDAVKGRDDDEDQGTPGGGLLSGLGSLFGARGAGSWLRQCGAAAGSLKQIWKNPALLIGAAVAAAAVAGLLLKPKGLRTVKRIAAAAGLTTTLLTTLRQVRMVVQEAQAAMTSHAASNGAAGAHARVPRDQPL